jgi:hypothetical protein
VEACETGMIKEMLTMMLNAMRIHLPKKLFIREESVKETTFKQLSKKAI